MNHLLMMHREQKERDDNISLIDAEKEFVERVDSWKQVLGQFMYRGLSLKTDVAHKGTQA